MNRNEISKGFQEGLMAARIKGTFLAKEYTVVCVGYVVYFLAKF